MNNNEEKLKKFLFDIINKFSKDADVYHHNGSLWLIHTNDRRWIVEFTKERTLWFNYNFFKKAFKVISLDINDKNEYVTEWFESRFLNMNRVKHILDVSNPNPPGVEDTIENGVKETLDAQGRSQISVENAIENGVKRTRFFSAPKRFRVEDTIENGVKDTKTSMSYQTFSVEETIQNGVKETNPTNFAAVDEAIQNGVKDTKFKRYDRRLLVEDAIQEGVKDTKLKSGRQTGKVEDTIINGVKKTDFNMYRDNNAVEDTIQNGVKETKRPLLPRTKRVEDAIENGVKKTYSTLRRTKLGVDDIIRNGVKDTKPMDEWVNAESIVEDTIEYGVKEIQPLPAQDGNRDWGNYYHGKEDRTKPFNEYLDEAIRFGVKEVIEENHHRTREVIITIKDGVKETYDDCSDNIARVEGIIRVGKKLDKDGI